MASQTTNTHDAGSPQGTSSRAARPAGYRRPLAPRRRFFDSAEHLEEPEPQLPIAWKELIQQLSTSMPRGPAGSTAGSTATTSASSSRRNSYGLSVSPVAFGLANPNNNTSLFGTLPLPYNSAPSTLRRSCSNLGA